MLRPILLATAVAAALPARAGPPAAAPPEAFPFSEQEDADGARFVWLMFEKGGLPYEYVPAKELRGSPHFVAVPKGQAGDLVWWPSRVALWFPDGTVRALGRSAEKLAEVEAKLGPVTILRYVENPPRRPRRIEFRRFGVRAVATAPDAYVWNEHRQIEQPRIAFLQVYRRELRLPDGSDADASFGIALERLDAARTPRAYAEALRAREPTLGAKLSEEGGGVVLRKDCEGRPCRLEVAVRVEGAVGVQALCVYHRAAEDRVKPDCGAWFRSVETRSVSTPETTDELRFFAPKNGDRVPSGTVELHGDGIRALSEHRYADAAAAYEKAMQLAPTYDGFALNHAMALLALGRIEQALPELARARPSFAELAPVIDGSIRDAYVRRGGRKLDDGDPAGALDDFREARRRDPSSAFAWSEESAALAQMREWPACVTTATEALSRQPDRVEALVNRAVCLARQGSTTEALADLDAALALAPLAKAYVSRALLKDQLGNRDGARADAEQVVRLDPGLAPMVERLLKE